MANPLGGQSLRTAIQVRQENRGVACEEASRGRCAEWDCIVPCGECEGSVLGTGPEAQLAFSLARADHAASESSAPG